MSKQRKTQKTKSGKPFDPAAFFETAAKGRTVSSGRPMSAVGQKRTWRHLSRMSALPPIADVRRLGRDVG